MENDCRLKQLMNTYTERSGATHVCSGQLLRESAGRERGTSEGLHRSQSFSVMQKYVPDKYNNPTLGALANILDLYKAI